MVLSLWVRRSLVLVLASATPATAQIFGGSSQADSADAELYGRSSSTNQQQQNRNGNSATTSSDAASANQLGTTREQQPYSPDQIRSADDRTNTRNTTDSTRNDDDQRDVGVDREQRYRPVRPLPRPSEFEVFASQIADRPLRRFGADLLVPPAGNYTTPPTATAPSDYRINPGDRLVLGLTGAVQADSLRLTVNSDGQIFVPRIGAVRVGGVRYGDLQSAISVQVSRQYRNFRVSVAVDRLHGITVYLTGFAAQPGSYTVSSLSTLVNAVLAGGGPSAGGSFRSIQLRRDGRLVSDFDLYDFLLKGDKSADSVLQNGDVIYIAPVGAQVAVIGSANNEAVFEARPRDTLTDVLLYAGGVNTAADMTRLLALDPLDLQAGWQALTPEQAGSQIARRAQVVRVLSNLGIARPLERQNVLVTLSGEVAHPGRYFVAPNTPMSAVLAQAGGLTSQAYVYGTVFTRESLRLAQRQSFDRAVQDVEYLLTATPLTSALAKDTDINRVSQLRLVVDQLRQRRPDGRLVLDASASASGLPDTLTLENNDSIYVPPRPVTVGVFGSVPSPASFQYRSGATVGEYLRKAGGVQKIGDKGQIFVVRANGTLLAPHGGLFGSGVLGQPSLPGDLIYVPINPARGEFWAKLTAATSVLFSGAVTAAAVASVTK